MSTSQGFSSRRKNAHAGVPSGEVLGTYESYPDAQALVTTLISGGVPAVALSILGHDVTLVERVTSRVGHGRAALSSAISGSWLGLLGGLVFAVFTPGDFVTPVLAGLLIGAGAGMVAGIIIFSFSSGKLRNFRSVQQVIAASYQVVVNPTSHSRALAAIESMNKPTAP